VIIIKNYLNDMIGERMNYDDVFIRTVTAAVLDILEGEIYWEYNFSAGTVGVDVPFYYSMTGDERFLLDTFVDDVVSDNRKVELNTDQIPRGMITWNGWNISTDEINNPNVWMKVALEDKDEIKNVLARVRPYPVVMRYDMSILLNNENDVFKCAEAVLDTLGIHKYFQFQYRMMNIMGVINLPEDHQYEKERTINLSSKNEVKFNLNFEVRTSYPAFRKPKRATRGIELNDNWSDAYLFDSFKKSEDEIIIPRRTKWYSNIYKSSGNTNPNSNLGGANG
jgi:hypothetical protein